MEQPLLLPEQERPRSQIPRHTASRTHPRAPANRPSRPTSTPWTTISTGPWRRRVRRTTTTASLGRHPCPRRCSSMATATLRVRMGGLTARLFTVACTPRNITWLGSYLPLLTSKFLPSPFLVVLLYEDFAHNHTISTPPAELPSVDAPIARSPPPQYPAQMSPHPQSGHKA